MCADKNLTLSRTQPFCTSLLVSLLVSICHCTFRCSQPQITPRRYSDRVLLHFLSKTALESSYRRHCYIHYHHFSITVIIVSIHRLQHGYFHAISWQFRFALAAHMANDKKQSTKKKSGAPNAPRVPHAAGSRSVPPLNLGPSQASSSKKKKKSSK